MNKLFIITGPAGVGKSTISMALGERLPKSVVIEGDTIYNFFVGGRIKPWEENAPLDLFWKNCFALIHSYLENGYDVVFNYIVEDDELDAFRKEFPEAEIIFRCLMVDEKTLLQRDQEREEDCQMGERCLILRRHFLECHFKENEFFDTTNLTVEETIKKILQESA